MTTILELAYFLSVAAILCLLVNEVDHLDTFKGMTWLGWLAMFLLILTPGVNTIFSILIILHNIKDSRK
jgi:hypothetical protein